MCGRRSVSRWTTGLPVGVQVAGHGCSAPAEGGVLITTGRMSGVVVDPRRRTVTVEAGVRFEQVIPAAAQHGLAPLGGSAPHVGVVGYVLGGGVGLLVRTYGYAADQVCSLEVVTADGSLLRVTPDTEPDLYWALLGGRDNFGIVTRLEMGLGSAAGIGDTCHSLLEGGLGGCCYAQAVPA
ncbi:FAD-binding oxidoreductase [Streptomyces bacillaris]|uniref:FAD-binding oxidoreductase n=1 Tax=Streptomyces bacillaris TaxID=68179 RepID=UPI0036524B01